MIYALSLIILGEVLVIVGIVRKIVKNRDRQIKDLKLLLVQRAEDLDFEKCRYNTLNAEYNKFQKEFAKLERRYIEEVEQREEMSKLMTELIDNAQKEKNKLKKLRKELRNIKAYREERIEELEDEVKKVTGRKSVKSGRKLKK